MNTDDLCDLADNVQTRSDFTNFLEQMLNNFRDHPDEWENNNLHDYLDGLFGFTTSLEGYYKNWNRDVDIEKLTWNMLADMLIAARVYE